MTWRHIGEFGTTLAALGIWTIAIYAKLIEPEPISCLVFIVLGTVLRATASLIEMRKN